MSLSKHELHALIDALPAGDPRTLAQCIDFVTAETLGFWHGRARAKMCRRLKHVHLSRDQRDRLVRCIADRLASGRFSEQFRDQLRLAMLLDPVHMAQVAERSAQSQVSTSPGWRGGRSSGSRHEAIDRTEWLASTGRSSNRPAAWANETSSRPQCAFLRRVECCYIVAKTLQGNEGAARNRGGEYRL